MSQSVQAPALWIERADMDGWMPPWVRRQSLARYRWASQFVRDQRVLDAACGTGYGSILLRREGAAACVVGLDAEPDSLRRAAERARGMNRVAFVSGDVLALPFPTASFDVYVSFETIEHVEDPNRLLNEAWRILRPGGRLLLSTPNRLVTNPGLPPNGRPLNPFHVREYDPRQLHTLLRERWARIELWGMSLFPTAYLRLLSAVPAGWYRAAARLNQAVKVPLELLGFYPTPGPVRCGDKELRRAEYLLISCVKPARDQRQPEPRQLPRPRRRAA